MIRAAVSLISLILTCLMFASLVYVEAAGAPEVSDEKNQCGKDGKAGTAETSEGKTLSGGQKTHHLVTVSTDGTITLSCIPLTEDEKRAGKKPQTWYLDKNGEFHLINTGSSQAERVSKLQDLLYQAGTPTVTTDGSISRTSMSADAFTEQVMGPSGVSNAIQRAFDGSEPPPVRYPVEDVMHTALANAIYGDGAGAEDGISRYFAFEDDFSRGYAQGVSDYGVVPLPPPTIGSSDSILPDGTIARGNAMPRGSYGIPVPYALTPPLTQAPFSQTFDSEPQFDLLSPDDPQESASARGVINRTYGALKGYASRAYNWLGSLF